MQKQMADGTQKIPSVEDNKMKEQAGLLLITFSPLQMLNQIPGSREYWQR